MNNEYDFVFRFLILGDAEVGKTAVLDRFADNTFTDVFICTIRTDFKIRRVEQDGRIIKLQVWDTHNGDRYRTMSPSFYRGAHAALLIYDVSNLESFLSIKQWLHDIDKNSPENVCKLIVGNKSDLTDRRVVTYEQGKDFADSVGIDFMETSAKNGNNVEAAFMTLTTQVQSRIKIQPSNPIVLTPQQFDGAHESNNNKPWDACSC